MTIDKVLLPKVLKVVKINKTNHPGHFVVMAFPRYFRLEKLLGLST